MSERNKTGQEKMRARALTIVYCVVILLAVVGVYFGYSVEWTGFGETAKQHDRIPQKTLWDWLNLLIVPLILAVGAVLLNKRIRDTELEVASKERDLDRQIANDRFAEGALQNFYDKISELLTKDNLRRADVDSDIVRIARARTLSLLSVLDGKRKGSVLRFLSETKLLQPNETTESVFPVILLGYSDLAGVRFENSDLENAHLHWVNMSDSRLKGTRFDNTIFQGAIAKNADMSGASFINAICEDADFTGSDFTGADMTGACFDRAMLQGVCFKDAVLDGARLNDAKGLSVEQVCQVKSMYGTYLPKDLEAEIRSRFPEVIDKLTTEKN